MQVERTELIRILEQRIDTESTVPRLRLRRGVNCVRQFMRREESSDQSACDVVTKVLMQNSPALDFLVDGDIRDSNSRGPNSALLQERVGSLPLSLVLDTSDRIERLMQVARDISSFSTASRLRELLPVTLPQTRAGFIKLRKLSHEYLQGLSIVPDTNVATNAEKARGVLAVLDEQVLERARSDTLLQNQIAQEARGLAAIRFPQLLAGDSLVLTKLRNIIVERKLMVMRREAVAAGGAREYSRFELAVNEIIEQENVASTIDVHNLAEGVSLRKAVLTRGKELLRKRLKDAVTGDELLELFAQRTIQELTEERARAAIDTALLEAQRTTLTDVAKLSELPTIQIKLIESACRLMASDDSPKTGTEVVQLEPGSRPKAYQFVVPQVTIGKSQLVSPENLLRFGTTVSLAATRDELASRINELVAGSPEFNGYFTTSIDTADGVVEQPITFYTPERKTEMLFSMVGRGAGSKLAGTPLFELRDDIQGLTGTVTPELDTNLTLQSRYGARLIQNTVRLSPLRACVGQPYAEGLVAATQLVADAVDTVSGNLCRMLAPTNKVRVPVEEITAVARAHLSSLLNAPPTEMTPGRELLQMDYFLLYPPETRRQILETFMAQGNLEGLEPPLASLTREGKLRLTIFDISGGAGGVGISEMLSQKLLGKSSGHVDAYISALLASYETKTGRLPKTVLIVPREADLTLMNVEYTILEDALFRVPGIEAVGITTMEILEQCLEVSGRTGGKLTVPTLKGDVIAPDLIVKRFTFLGEGRCIGCRGDVLVTLPHGVVMEPSNASRLVASDKRINSPILAALTAKLAPLGVEVMPYLDLDLASCSLKGASDEIVQFMEQNKRRYPEIAFLGAVLKTTDKIPGREGVAGEVISAYSIPASVLSSLEMRRAFIGKKLRELALKGVKGVIVQPNVLSLVVDNEGTLLPKFELKMMAFARRKNSNG